MAGMTGKWRGVTVVVVVVVVVGEIGFRRNSVAGAGDKVAGLSLVLSSLLLLAQWQDD
jgi:hypothetical protein